MKVVIVGAGSIGFQLGKQLINEGHDVTMLEKNAAAVRYVAERLDCKVINSSGTNLSALQEAKLENADYFIALTDSDEVNLASSYIVGVEFPHLHKVIRIRNLEYNSIEVIERSLVGKSQVVHPPHETAEAIIRSIEHGAVGDIYEFANGEIQLHSYLLHNPQSIMLGQTVQQLRLKFQTPFLIPLIKRADKVFIPSADTQIQLNDTVYISAGREPIQDLIKKLGFEKKEGKKVVILGGGDIGLTIGNYLSGKGYSRSESEATKNNSWFHSLKNWFTKSISLPKYRVKYVERDYNRCKLIAEALPHVDVVNADISEENLFEEENLGTADIFVAATDNQELNMITALFAKNYGISRAIVLVRTSQMRNVAANLGLDVVVSTANTMVNAIVRYIHGEHLHSIQSLVDGSMEILELQVAESAHVRQRLLKDIKFPQDTLVTYIYRKDTAILPNGDSTLLEGDRVIIICKKQSVEKIMLLFNSKHNVGS